MNQDDRTLVEELDSILSDKLDEEASTDIDLPETRCGCNNISRNLLELSRKVAALENSLIKSNSSLSPSYEDLLLKIKTLEQERESLLTVIRLSQEESEMKLHR